VSLYDSISGLPVAVDDYQFSLRERETSSGFTRTTTIVELHGAGETGYGEDVTYESDAHYRFHESDEYPPLAGEYTFERFSETVAESDFFPEGDPEQSMFRNYRRWAFESAALDIALKQADTTLGEALGRAYDPVRFVVSTRLGEPPTFDRIETLLGLDSALEFKLDPTDEWTPELVERLAETDAVRILDLKGQYEGTDVDQSGDPDRYEMLVEAFPEAIIEDPDLTDETRPIIEAAGDRVSWDYPITGVESVEALPWEPNWLNIKPSRFGSVRSVLATIEYARDRGIRCYGGGQFELDVGRAHIQALASLFYPDAPNDVAPGGYNDPEPTAGLPSSPLSPPQKRRGIAWEP
jgi:L-alanine-DL-glutamate epimerase-like enolase superfamily enzyme